MTKALQAGIAACLLTSPGAAVTADASVCGEIFFAATVAKEQKTVALTVLVAGMMKSRSGAT